jgi:outer membrane biosynthesis protein TonB
LDDAVDFTRDAWRGAFAPMALTALGWTLLVVAGQAQIAVYTARLLRHLGFVLLLFHVPLWGALYRQVLAAGAPVSAQASLWARWGLRLGAVEGRLLALIGVVGVGLGAACALPMLVSAVLFVLLHRLGGVTLGPLGHWAWWFLAAAMIWCAFLAGLLYLCGRLSLSVPLSLNARRVRPWAGWYLTQGQAWPIAAAVAAAHAPMLLVWLGLLAVGWIEPPAAPAGMHGAWPVLDAVAAGLVAGTALAAVQAPLTIGVDGFALDMLTPIPGENPVAAADPVSGAEDASEGQPDTQAEDLAIPPHPAEPQDEPEAAVAPPKAAAEPDFESEAEAGPEPDTEPEPEPEPEEKRPTTPTTAPESTPERSVAAPDVALPAAPPLDGADEAEHATP